MKKTTKRRLEIKRLNSYKLRSSRLVDIQMENMGYPESTELRVLRSYIFRRGLTMNPETGYIFEELKTITTTKAPDAEITISSIHYPIWYHAYLSLPPWTEVHWKSYAMAPNAISRYQRFA